jgi:predicted HTH domain antitoxin
MPLQIAEAIAEFLPTPPDAAASELIVLELYRQRRISRGKAAELLGEPLATFLQRAAHADIPYFDLTSDELQREIESAEDFARARAVSDTTKTWTGVTTAWPPDVVTRNIKREAI